MGQSVTGVNLCICSWCWITNVIVIGDALKVMICCAAKAI
jgi:hypothetical protein